MTITVLTGVLRTEELTDDLRRSVGGRGGLLHNASASVARHNGQHRARLGMDQEATKWPSQPMEVGLYRS